MQSVQLGGGGTLNGAAALTDSEFYIVYHDPYGGVWRTDGITGTLDDAVAATRVQSALRALPNEVLEGITVAARSGDQNTCTRVRDGAQHIPSAGGHGTTNDCGTTYSAGTNKVGASATAMDFDITFADKPGQTGTQFLFEVNTEVSADGAYPKSKGFNTATSSGTTVEGKTVVANVHEVIAGTTAAGRQSAVSPAPRTSKPVVACKLMPPGAQLENCTRTPCAIVEATGEMGPVQYSLPPYATLSAPAASLSPTGILCRG